MDFLGIHRSRNRPGEVIIILVYNDKTGLELPVSPLDGVYVPALSGLSFTLDVSVYR